MKKLDNNKSLQQFLDFVDYLGQLRDSLLQYGLGSVSKSQLKYAALSLKNIVYEMCQEQYYQE